MGDFKAKIGPNGRIVIPAACRKALGVGPGDELLLRLEDDSIQIMTREAALQRAQERVAKYIKDDRSWVDELIEERRRWAEKE